MAAAAAAEPGAPMDAEIDFEEESALLELASTQPDVKQEPGLEPGEWEQELSLLAMAQEQEQVSWAKKKGFELVCGCY